MCQLSRTEPLLPILLVRTINTANCILMYWAMAFANCAVGFDVQFSNSDADCTYQPNNDECSGTFALQIGTNGPYDNYCASNNNTDPINTTCLPDRLTNTVWYSFVGNGQQLIIYPKYCGGISPTEMQAYENDLQMLIYTNCPAESGSELVCSDDVLSFQPQAIIPTIAGQTYYVLIDGYGVYDAQGEFCIELETCPTTRYHNYQYYFFVV
jgi:hypothetical protein